MTPATAAYRLTLSVLLGAALGLGYGFLRPLRRRRCWMADTLFLLAVFWTWVYYGFGICGGDLRLGYLVGMALGGAVWEGAFGPALTPVFAGFWKGIRRLSGLMILPAKKILQLAKI